MRGWLLFRLQTSEIREKYILTMSSIHAEPQLIWRRRRNRRISCIRDYILYVQCCTEVPTHDVLYVVLSDFQTYRVIKPTTRLSRHTRDIALAAYVPKHTRYVNTKEQLRLGLSRGYFNLTLQCIILLFVQKIDT